MSWLRRLRSEWIKNDGKPREEWAPGLDLKEMAALGCLALLLVVQAVATVLMFLT